MKLSTGRAGAVCAAALASLFVGATSAAAPIDKTYIVQLGDAPAAAYAGNVAGYTATRPASGRRFDTLDPNVRAYVAFLERRRDAAVASVGGIRVEHRYNLAFNGFSARLNDAQVRGLIGTPGVVSVTPAALRHVVTTTTPAFLGLTKPGGLWSQLDARSRAVKGEDVVIGMLDTGIAPEDPSFSDKVDPSTNEPVAYSAAGTVAYGPPVQKWKGICQTGPGFTAAVCNNKVIGARFYPESFGFQGQADVPPGEYFSPRDGQGHGSHTASTAGGNEKVSAKISGFNVGKISGMAPRARLAIYKVCWPEGCFDSDVMKAIDDAVADGVDIISLSVSGTETDFSHPVELAFLNAATAGVFSSVAAGNEGGNSVNHPSPWLTTVAASSQLRSLIATVRLGNGATFSGPTGYQAEALPAAALVWSRNAGRLPYTQLSIADQQALGRCYDAATRASLGSTDLGALDPAKVRGKIVVCERGVSYLIDKAITVRSAGGVGMVLQNVPIISDDTLFAQPYAVPTVHLKAIYYDAVTGYASSTAPTASIGAPVQDPNAIAPVVAEFSSGGPNFGNPDIMKPDLAAPGVDIIAAYVDTTLTPEQAALVAAGSFTPLANATALSGTSMATPHVAGIAALLHQLHPDWSSSAIKSALLTTTTDLRLPTGEPDPNRNRYGAGHVNPNGAADPGLVYDTAPADYGRFLCGQSLTPPATIGSCSTLGSVTARELNQPYIMVSALQNNASISRKVTNVSGRTATFVATTAMPGYEVRVTPASLTLSPGQTGSFDVALSRTSAPLGVYAFGNLFWSDGVHTVRTPLTARAISFVAPAVLTDSRAVGNKLFTVLPGVDTLRVTTTDLLAETLHAGVVAANAKQCFTLSVPAAIGVARFQLRQTDPNGPANLDLSVLRNGAEVGASGGPSADETVTLTEPSPGNYSVCVTGVSGRAQGGAGYSVSSWLLPSASQDILGSQRLKAAVPFKVQVDKYMSAAASWSVPAGPRYLGQLQFRDRSSSVVGTTLMVVGPK